MATALALDAKNKSDTIRTDFERAIHCLVQLGRIDEVDAFREAVIALHQGNWRMLEAAAASCLDDTQHFGTMIAGKFHRGGNRGGGRSLGSYERDRSRSLQLLTQGLELVRTEPNRRDHLRVLPDVRSCPNGPPRSGQLVAASKSHTSRRAGRLRRGASR